MSSEIEYEPTGNLTLSDGKNHITLPQWTRGVLSDIFGHETERLQDENRNLRRERDFYFKQVTENGERAHGAIDALNAENEKLRELVQDVMPIVCDGCHERLCKMPKEEHPFITCLFADRMFELGIEVD